MRRLESSERIHLLSKNATRGDESCWRTRGCQKKSNQSPNNPTDTNSAVGDATKNNGWSVIVFGQTIALALSCANAASSSLENNYQIKVPTFQTGLVYFILSFHLVYLFWRHGMRKRDGNFDGEVGEDIPRFREIPIEHSGTSSFHATINNTRPSHTFPFTTLPLHAPWHTYLLLSVLDVEANFLAMLSFQHTSLSSSMLLTSLSVFSTVLLRRLVFRTANYGGRRLLGIAICLIGGCAWLREEFFREGAESDGDGPGAPHPAERPRAYVMQGDLLALAAAFLYGLNDVLAEYFMKANNDRVEYLGMLGFFGSVFSFVVQAPLLEGDRLRNLFAGAFGVHDAATSDYDGGGDYSTPTIGAIFLLLCFIITLCYFYMSVMSFLAVYDSTILNLSLQSCPLWAVLLTMLQTPPGENGGRAVLPPAMFFVSLTMVMVGMFLYESHSGTERSDGDSDERDSCGDDANAKLDTDYNTEVT